MKIIEIEEEVIVKKGVSYIADDGTKFKSEQKCIEYEEECSMQNDIENRIKFYKKKFKFRQVKLYDCDYGETIKKDIVYVNTAQELLFDVIKCYKGEVRYGRPVEVEQCYDVVNFPCWVIIEETDRDSNCKFTSSLKETYDNYSNCCLEMEKILNS